ncbi:hypothetical protein ACROYT_G028097 [Oculina patagonica]
MTFAHVAFCWSILFITASITRTNALNSTQSVQNDKATTVVPADDKCSIIVNGDYYAGPNREIKTILRGIQAQLSEMQEQIREIQKENGNKTAVMRSCADVYKSGERISGVYTIKPDDGDPFDVYCD